MSLSNTVKLVKIFKGFIRPLRKTNDKKEIIISNIRKKFRRLIESNASSSFEEINS